MGAHYDQGITALGKRFAILTGVLLLGACESWHNYSPLRDELPQTHPTLAEIPVVDWQKARHFRMLMTEFAFSPTEPKFVAGDAYRMVLRNAGAQTHILTGTNLWRAIAIRNIEITPWLPHGSDGHADKPVGPKNADLLPTLPASTDLETVVDKTRAESAKTQAKIKSIEEAATKAYEAKKEAGDAPEADDPFAAPAEEGEAGASSDDPFAAEAEDADETAAADDPFAEKPEDADETASADDPFAEKPEETDETASADDPFAEKPEETDETASADDPLVEKPEESDEAEEDPFAAKTEDDDSPIETDGPADENPAETEELKETETADAEDDGEADNADDDAAAEDGDAEEESENADTGDEDDGEAAPETGWAPIIVENIEVPPGHEAVIEFVAVRPGVYGFWSEIGPFVAMGMFGEATIEVITEDEAEVETAAVTPPESETVQTAETAAEEDIDEDEEKTE